MPSCFRPEHVTPFFSNPVDFLYLRQEEASKAGGKKPLEGVTNEKERGSPAMQEKAEGLV